MPHLILTQVLSVVSATHAIRLCTVTSACRLRTWVEVVHLHPLLTPVHLRPPQTHLQNFLLICYRHLWIHKHHQLLTNVQTA